MAEVTNILSDALTYNGHRYYIYSDTVAGTWEEAKAFCEARGGHLAVINDAAENTALFNYMKAQGYNSAYFGFSDATAEGTWTWVTNESVNYTNWHSGEPSNGNKADKPENYGMFYWQFTDGTWNDGDFTDYGTDSGGHAFICEWDTTIPSDALIYNGHRYYVYPDIAETWEDAEAFCEALGGHLAVITDVAENTAVFNYMKAQGHDSAYFGLSDATQEGTWTWVNDEQVDYTNWASGEPNNENNNEDYVSFYYKFPDGKWNDGNFAVGATFYSNGKLINDTRAFICEWDSIDDTNTSVYTGGDQVISNYGGQAIMLSSGYYLGAYFSSDNFVVTSLTGTLTIQNVTDKVVDLRNSKGDEFMKAYKASAAGIVDGRGIAVFEVIEGSSAGVDVIFAGDGGSQLWGGADTAADAIAGGNGRDIFIGGRFQGSDNFYNVSSADTVSLTDASLSDIVGVIENNGALFIGFNTGAIIGIHGTDTLSAAIYLADGTSWRFNHVTKSWQGA